MPSSHSAHLGIHPISQPFRRVSKSAPPARCGRGISDPQRSSKSFQNSGASSTCLTLDGLVMFGKWHGTDEWRKKNGPKFPWNIDWLIDGKIISWFSIINPYKYIASWVLSSLLRLQGGKPPYTRHEYESLKFFQMFSLGWSTSAVMYMYKYPTLLCIKKNIYI